MRLHVGLVHDIQAVPVAQVQEVRVRRVVAGADAVHVVLLHQHDVPLHVLARHGIAAVRVRVVVVDPAQFDGDAVDEQLLVGDPNVAETDGERQHFC